MFYIKYSHGFLGQINRIISPGLPILLCLL